MFDWFQNTIQESMKRFLDKRLHDTKHFTLDRNKIFIIPSRLGLVFIVLTILLLLMGINFQNNLVYLICFWLLSLIVINILYTFRNLSGITITVIRNENCFAEQNAGFELEISSRFKRNFSAVDIGWADVDMSHFDLHENEQVRINLSHPTEKRGIIKPPRILLVTRFPTGLCRAWAYAQMDLRALVYPKPILQDERGKDASQGDESEDGKEVANGTSDFSSVREYRAGDSLKQIHWPQFAKTGELATREFVDYQSHELWLDFDSIQIIGHENRLSHICAKVLQFHEEQKTYGLKLGETVIEPDTGEHHKNACLTQLALFGVAEGGRVS